MLERAWRWREQRGILAEAQAVRVFHGPGEGTGPWRQLAIDRYGAHYWVTEWGESSEAALEEIARFLKAQDASSAVVLARPEKGIPSEPRPLLGDPPAERYEIEEQGARFRVQMLGARHPGLFLDHAPLRHWLRKRSQGWKALNTFAYTGSLSVACGLGGAAHVTTLDLSKPTIRWAEENWNLNALESSQARFIAGDVFEWLPRLKREGARYDCVLLDPPSFSRGTQGTFSTSKDLKRLHELALDLLAPGGFLISSINSANVPRAKFESEIRAAAGSRGRKLQVLEEISLPETFPSPLGDAEARYLKGLILRAQD